MEIMYSNDVVNEFLISDLSSVMTLYIAKYALLISYCEKEKNFIAVVNSSLKEDLSSEDLLHLLNSLSGNGRYEIIRNNPNSEQWQSIRIMNGKLGKMISRQTLSTEKRNPYYKGCKYIQEVLYRVCRRHILGNKVSVSDTIRKTAKLHRMSTEELIESMHTALRDGVYGCNGKEYEDKYTVETFIRIISHDILDNVYFYTHISEKIFGR